MLNTKIIPLIILVFIFQISCDKQQSSQTDPEKPSKVAAICLWAEDVPSAVKFYKDVFDLEEIPTNFGNFTRLRLDGAVLIILNGVPREAENTEQPFPLFALTVKDLDETYTKLKESGAKIPTGIEGSGSHRELQFYDPAGNRIEAVQR
jgi:predicted enzyme related to lactoylglutathione lyase